MSQCLFCPYFKPVQKEYTAQEDQLLEGHCPILRVGGGGKQSIPISPTPISPTEIIPICLLCIWIGLPFRRLSVIHPLSKPIQALQKSEFFLELNLSPINYYLFIDSIF